MDGRKRASGLSSCPSCISMFPDFNMRDERGRVSTPLQDPVDGGADDFLGFP